MAVYRPRQLSVHGTRSMSYQYYYYAEINMSWVSQWAWNDQKYSE